ncbi:MAG: AraC family transcriptional regulator [Colwellia sp.]|nr:AraC family transcriptional regulator [Colwellia sp.]
MGNNLLSSWNYRSKLESTPVILPDGCRDLIMKVVNKGKPEWFVSPMYDKAEIVSIEANSVLSGYRMKPGVNIAEKALLSSLYQSKDNIDDISNLLSDFTDTKCSVQEALACLATNICSVKQVAKELGVSSRTLQRLIVSNTNKSPTYWILLARARRAARALTESITLAEIAEVYGYADQSHMNREFKRWFDTTPLTMRTKPNVLRQLYNKGYD